MVLETDADLAGYGLLCRSLEPVVLAAVAAWIERNLRQEILCFSCDCCELVLTADARLDEGMLYADDPFDDLDDSSDDDSATVCVAANCDSASAGNSLESEPEASAAEILVQEDTTGATFCWPAALTLCNFLLENKDFISGKKVLFAATPHLDNYGVASGFTSRGDVVVIEVYGRSSTFEESLQLTRHYAKLQPWPDTLRVNLAATP